MDLLLRGKEESIRNEKPLRIQVKITKPTGRHHTTVNFAELVSHLETKSDDEDSSDDDSAGSFGAVDPTQMLDLEDLMAKGAGYDFDDEFIDDSAAIKQSVQHQKVPIYSGYFVHKGPIPLKEAPIEDPESPKKTTKTPTKPVKPRPTKSTNFNLPEPSAKSNGSKKRLTKSQTAPSTPAHNPVDETINAPANGLPSTSQSNPKNSHPRPKTPTLTAQNDKQNNTLSMKKHSDKERIWKIQTDQKAKTAPSTPQQTSGASTPTPESRRTGKPPTLKQLNPITISESSESASDSSAEEPRIRRMVGLPPIARKRK